MPLQTRFSPPERLAPGRRRMTPDSIRHDMAARGFESLPEGVKHPLELLAAVKRARVPHGLPAAVIELLDLLFAFTEPRDWQDGSRPIVWPSNRYLQSQLGLTRSGLQKRIRQGLTLGLFAMKDAPNGQRRGRRDAEGRIVLEASFGFDLSPLAVRHDEFRAAGAGHRAAFRAREAMRRRGFIAKSALLQLAETAEEEGLSSPYWDSLASRLDPLSAVLKAADQTCELTAAIEVLEGLRAEAEARLTQALADAKPAPHQADPDQPIRTEESEPMGLLLGALKNITDSIPVNPTTSNKARQEQGSAGGEGSPQRSKPASIQGAPPADFEGRVALSVILDAVPDLAAFCAPGQLSWPGAADAAQRICAHWEISQRNWGRACQVLGREGAVIAFAVMVHHHSRGGVASPGGYFYRMIERAERGELDLIRSYHGIRTRLYGRDRRPAH